MGTHLKNPPSSAEEDHQKPHTLEELLEQSGRKMENFLRKKCREANISEAAEDLIQLVYLKSLKNEDNILQADRPEAYLMTLARNAFVDWIRKQERAEKKFSELAAPDSGRSFDPPDKGPDPVAELLEKEHLQLVNEAIATLSPKEGEALRLRILDGKSYEEICEMTGDTLGAVKSQIRRGRLALQEILKDHGRRRAA